MEDEDLLTIDVKDDYLRDVDAGADGLDIFIVAPARLHKFNDFDLLREYNAFVTQDKAIHSAKSLCKINKKAVCVYRLVPVVRANFVTPEN